MTVADLYGPPCTWRLHGGRVCNCRTYYNNPTKTDIDKKSTYFVKQGDLILEAGIYKGK